MEETIIVNNFKKMKLNAKEVLKGLRISPFKSRENEDKLFYKGNEILTEVYYNLDKIIRESILEVVPESITTKLSKEEFDSIIESVKQSDKYIVQLILEKMVIAELSFDDAKFIIAEFKRRGLALSEAQELVTDRIELVEGYLASIKNSFDSKDELVKILNLNKRAIGKTIKIDPSNRQLANSVFGGAKKVKANEIILDQNGNVLNQARYNAAIQESAAIMNNAVNNIDKSKLFNTDNPIAKKLTKNIEEKLNKNKEKEENTAAAIVDSIVPEDKPVIEAVETTSVEEKSLIDAVSELVEYAESADLASGVAESANLAEKLTKSNIANVVNDVVGPILEQEPSNGKPSSNKNRKKKK